MFFKLYFSDLSKNWKRMSLARRVFFPSDPARYQLAARCPSLSDGMVPIAKKLQGADFLVIFGFSISSWACTLRTAPLRTVSNSAKILPCA